jgi:carboxyl-terminal processing protease
MPDIVVTQPARPVDAAEGEEETSAARRPTSEADLRGIISNDSMTEDERKLLEEERARVEETAKLRDEDYQLAYAVDILRGLNAVAAPVAEGQ